MIEQRAYMPQYGWRVTVFYESGPDDAERIIRRLVEAQADDETVKTAEDNLRSGSKDTGLTYSNFGNRETVIVISKTSSKQEFANTWVHEVLHCAIHIASAIGLDLKGEPVAYIAGELAMEMQPVAAAIMCPKCDRKHRPRF